MMMSWPYLELNTHFRHLCTMRGQKRGLPQWLSSTESTCNVGDAGDAGSIPGQEDPLEEGMAAHLGIFEESQGHRSLVGCSPWGHKELDITEVTEHAH